MSPDPTRRHPPGLLYDRATPKDVPPFSCVIYTAKSGYTNPADAPASSSDTRQSPGTTAQARASVVVDKDGAVLEFTAPTWSAPLVSRAPGTSARRPFRRQRRWRPGKPRALRGKLGRSNPTAAGGLHMWAPGLVRPANTVTTSRATITTAAK